MTKFPTLPSGPRYDSTYISAFPFSSCREFIMISSYKIYEKATRRLFKIDSRMIFELALFHYWRKKLFYIFFYS